MSRKQQADTVRTLLNQWQSAAEAFDQATSALETAQNNSNAAFRAYNAVAWKLQEHSGASDADKVAALQLKIASDTAAAAIPPLFSSAANASQLRGGLEVQLRAATDALSLNPGAVENMGGTPLV